MDGRVSISFCLAMSSRNRFLWGIKEGGVIPPPRFDVSADLEEGKRFLVDGLGLSEPWVTINSRLQGLRMPEGQAVCLSLSVCGQVRVRPSLNFLGGTFSPVSSLDSLNLIDQCFDACSQVGEAEGEEGTCRLVAVGKDRTKERNARKIPQVFPQR